MKLIYYFHIISIILFLFSCSKNEIKGEQFLSFHLTKNKHTLFFELHIKNFYNKKKDIRENGDDKDLSITWYNNFSVACEIADLINTNYEKKITNDYSNEYEKYSELPLNKKSLFKLINQFDPESSIQIEVTKHHALNKGYRVSHEKVNFNDALNYMLNFIDNLDVKELKYDYMIESYDYHAGSGELIATNSIENFIELRKDKISCHTSQLDFNYDHIKTSEDENMR